MEWLVLIHKETGELSITTREARNISLADHFHFRMKISTRVLKTFKSYKEAQLYIRNINNGDEILKSIK